MKYNRKRRKLDEIEITNLLRKVGSITDVITPSVDEYNSIPSADFLPWVVSIPHTFEGFITRKFNLEVTECIDQSVPFSGGFNSPYTRITRTFSATRKPAFP